MKEIKIRMEIKETGNTKYERKINEIKSWFLEKTNEMDKSLVRLPKKKREKTQLLKQQGDTAVHFTCRGYIPRSPQ